MSDKQKLTVIGSGQMGAGIAQVAAMANLDVTMIDIKPEFIENGLRTIGKSLKKFVEKEKISEEKAKSVLEGIATSLDNELMGKLLVLLEYH